MPCPALPCTVAAPQAIILGLIVASLWATITPTASEGRQVMSLASLSVQVGRLTGWRAGQQALWQGTLFAVLGTL